MSLLSLFAAARPSVDEEIRKKQLEAAISAPLSTSTSTKPKLLSTAELLKYYGQPGDPDNLTVITCPYPMRIAWNLSQITNRISVHKKVAPHLAKVFDDLLSHYGIEKIQAMGIDLFGGLNNFRPQRGLETKYTNAIKAKNFSLALTYLSRHSWATAIDLDPVRNALKTKSPKAQFSRPEYKPMNDIFYANKFIGYGRERNNDWMHYEIGIILN